MTKSGVYHRGGISVEILADSINPAGNRLITWLWKYPRMIHAEIMTHRMLSRNSASSRAIPAKKLRERVLANPAEPISWGQNQAGMQANEEVAEPEVARALWLNARDNAARWHKAAEDLKLHKQIVNRLIEPWMTIEVVVSATDHANLFHQRRHTAAEPSFQALSNLAWQAFDENMPRPLNQGEWHLPMIDDTDLEWLQTTSLPVLPALQKLSVGRCARVSYLTHEGRRDPLEDIALHDRLRGTFDSGDPGHFSPFEHQAQALHDRERVGNFEGWRQYRKMFANEAGPNTSVLCPLCGMWGDEHTKACRS